MSWEILQIATVAGVGIYAAVITILALHLVFCRRSKKCETCSSYKPEDLETLNRTSVANEYRPLSSSSQCDLRSHSLSGISNAANRMSEYDTFACTSKSHDSVALRSKDQDVADSRLATPSLPHHYEEIKSEQDLKELEFIIKQVTDILCTFEGKVREQVAEQFVKLLMQNIKAQHPNLYACPRPQDYHTKHQYEIVLESDKPAKPKKDFDDDDDTYGKYVPPTKTAFQKKFKSLGSSDHLQYLKESRKNLLDVPDKDDYMEPKRYSARSQCPEDLRLLSEQNKSNKIQKTYDEDSKNKISRCFIPIQYTATLSIGHLDSQERFTSESSEESSERKMYDSALALPECDRRSDENLEHENIEGKDPSSYQLPATSNNSSPETKICPSLSFRVRAQEVEKVLILRPKLPPKKNRNLSEGDIRAEYDFF